MTPKSIRSHLAPYSIYSKRRTTIAHAFASALAPSDEYDGHKVEAALIVLGQTNLRQLACVYCGKPAQTWDHLENLVKAGKLNGYGHQIDNLVPCCRDGNSEKGGKPFHEYVGTLDLSPEAKADLVTRLERHLLLAELIDMSGLSQDEQDALEQFNAIQNQILKLMEDADRIAHKLRKTRKG